jgi:hypothetical protein
MPSVAPEDQVSELEDEGRSELSPVKANHALRHMLARAGEMPRKRSRRRATIIGALTTFPRENHIEGGFESRPSRHVSVS